LKLIKAFAFTIVVVFFSCNKKAENSGFSSLSSSRTNIDFVNSVEDSDELNILDYLYFYNGAGVAAGDVNSDGLADLYFVSNLGENKLYINQGNMKFSDATETAGLQGQASWQTAAAMVDINADDLLDIYVSAVSGIHGFTGHNELYINNGDGSFTESAKDYGLDIAAYGSALSFFDYDRDGDLDAYVLNHAVHTQESYTEVEKARNEIDENAGDRLLRNDDGKFVDVSREAGIYSSVIGYGLAVTASDFNSDGWIDIYVSNDFHEDDYYYVNNGDGTFTNSLTDYFPHTSRFSMGSDAADFNGDGMQDLFVADMLPQEESILKSSVGDDSKEIYDFKLSYGYHHQYSRNVLQYNNGQSFTDVAQQKEVAATDWSWSPLAQDFNNDGLVDLYVSTGILRRPNNLDYIKFLSSADIASRLEFSNDLDKEAISKMPSGLVKNQMFLQTADNQFLPVDIDSELTSSPGSAFADLDNDGDMDIITNDVNHPPRIYKNNTKSSGLSISLQGQEGNTKGIGSVIEVSAGEFYHRSQFMPYRGFMSSSQPLTIIGLPDSLESVSVLVTWPDGREELRKDVRDSAIEFIQEDAVLKTVKSEDKQGFKMLNTKYFLTHEENEFNDFNREKLLPYQLSKLGPAFAVADLNNDGFDDFYFGNALYTKSVIGYGTGTDFEYESVEDSEFVEDVAAAILDIDGDGGQDILVLSGGKDSDKNVGNLKYKFLSFYDGKYRKRDIDLPLSYRSEYATLAVADFDLDGLDDLFIGARYSTKALNSATSILLKNEGGYFLPVEVPELNLANMVTSATWEDLDADGMPDLIIAGEWMRPMILMNSDSGFNSLDIDMPSGMFQHVDVLDIDGDGSKDILFGNYGTNSKLNASVEDPLRLYVGDFDSNSGEDYILESAKNGRYYPVASIDDLASQLVSVRKGFTSYSELAGRTTKEIFSADYQYMPRALEAETLESMVLYKGGSEWIAESLPIIWQSGPITASGKFGNQLLIGGNLSIFSPNIGSMNGMPISLLTSTNNGLKQSFPVGMSGIRHDVRHLEVLKGTADIYAVVSNDGPLSFYTD